MLGPVSLPTPTRCLDCGYDLRGTSSPCCPECGGPRIWKRLAFSDEEELRFAAAVLAKERISIRVVDAVGGAVILPGLARPNMVGEILVSDVDADRALRALEEAGIHVPVPIVDRDEPICPACESALDPTGTSVCNACGASFQWFDSAPGLFEGDPCPFCGEPYEANASGQCLECGADLAGHQDAAGDQVVEPKQAQPSVRPRHFALALILVLYLLSISLMFGEIARWDQSGKITALGAIAVLGLLLAILLAVRLKA